MGLQMYCLDFFRKVIIKKKLRAENSQILHWLQTSLTNTNRLHLSVLLNLTPLHQIFICKTHIFLQLCKFWSIFHAKLANERPYKANIGIMRLRLQKLQETDSKAQELRSNNGYQNINKVLYYQGFFFLSKAICMEFISSYHENLLAGHFGIEKTYKLLAQNYF